MRIKPARKKNNMLTTWCRFSLDGETNQIFSTSLYIFKQKSIKQSCSKIWRDYPTSFRLLHGTENFINQNGVRLRSGRFAPTRQVLRPTKSLLKLSVAICCRVELISLSMKNLCDFAVNWSVARSAFLESGSSIENRVFCKDHSS